MGIKPTLKTIRAVNDAKFCANSAREFIPILAYPSQRASETALRPAPTESINIPDMMRLPTKYKSPALKL